MSSTEERRRKLTFGRAENKMTPYERHRAAVAKRAGFKSTGILSTKDFRFEQTRPKEIEIWIDKKDPYIETCFTVWDSIRSFATSVDTKSFVLYNRPNVWMAKQIRKEFIRNGVSKGGKVFQLHYYSKYDNRRKNDSKHRISQGKSLIKQIELMPNYFEVAGAKNRDATIGKPGGLPGENQLQAAILRSKLYKKIVVNELNSLKFYNLSLKTGIQILHNYKKHKRNTYERTN
jgi:hypothetical protein